MEETHYIQKGQEKGDIDHLIFQETEADQCESCHGRKQDNESLWWKQREKLQAEYLNMTKKRNSAVQRYATHLQVEVIQDWFETTIFSSKSSPGYPKNSLNCSCQIIRRFVGKFYFIHWGLYCIFHSAGSISKSSIIPRITLQCAQSYLSAHNQTPKLGLTERAIAHPGQHLLSKQIEIL